jgi:hypothetical protein
LGRSGGEKATLTDDYFKEGEIDSLNRASFKALMRRELKRSLSVLVDGRVSVDRRVGIRHEALIIPAV